MGDKTVDGDNLDGLWDAITDTEPFDVCFDQMFEGCYHAPGFGSWGACGLLVFELVFWFFVARYGYKRIKGNKAHPQVNVQIDRPHFDDNVDRERSERRLTRSPFPSRPPSNRNRRNTRKSRKRSKRR